MYRITCPLILSGFLLLPMNNAQGGTEQGQDIKPSALEQERDWYRFQALLLRAYTGHLRADEDLKELAVLRDRFERGALQGKDKREVEDLIKKLDRELGWDAARKRPTRTYGELLAGAEKDLVVKAQDLQDAKTALAKAEADLKARTNDLALLRADYQKELDKLKKGGAQDVAKYVEKILEQQKQLDDLARERETLKDKLGRMEEQHARLLKKLEKEKPEVPLPRADVPMGKVIQTDRTGKVVFISLGSADGVKVQAKFHLHGVTADGKPEREPKATVEVVEVLGPRLSQARITEQKDPNRDPVLKGDLVLSPK